MDLKFGELVILAESLLSQIDFDSLLSKDGVDAKGGIDVIDSLLVKENDIHFDKVALLDKILVEILKHRPLPF